MKHVTRTYLVKMFKIVGWHLTIKERISNGCFHFVHLLWDLFTVHGNTKIYDILRKTRVEGYFRYVDDILLIYNENITNTEERLSMYNKITPDLNFILEQEQDNKLNFLDLTIQKTTKKMTFDIHRKPTMSDVIIP